MKTAKIWEYWLMFDASAGSEERRRMVEAKIRRRLDVSLESSAMNRLPLRIISEPSMPLGKEWEPYPLGPIFGWTRTHKGRVQGQAPDIWHQVT
jgi:hypothetical protein